MIKHKFEIVVSMTISLKIIIISTLNIYMYHFPDLH